MSIQDPDFFSQSDNCERLFHSLYIKYYIPSQVQNIARLQMGVTNTFHWLLRCQVVIKKRLLSKIPFFSFVKIWVVDFVTIWVVEVWHSLILFLFCHNLSLVTILVLSHFKFCQNLSFVKARHPRIQRQRSNWPRPRPRQKPKLRPMPKPRPWPRPRLKLRPRPRPAPQAGWYPH